MIAALAMPVFLGALGVGAETASWMSSKRAMQNAADAAAIAAATNASSNFDVEAKAVTAQYGFKNGADGVTVTATDTATCTGSSTCYTVTVSRAVPLLLAQIVGYKGDTTVDGSPAKTIAATAVAIQGTSPRPYCLLALGNQGVTPAIRTNGAPKADMVGCNVMSNNDATCNGHDLNADVGDAHGKNDGCGVIRNSNVASVKDPYKDLAKNIPADPCKSNYGPWGSSGKGNGKKSGGGTADPNPISDAWAGDTQHCGTITLPNDVTLTQDTTIYIYNGDLNTNGFTLSAADGVAVTVVFTGTDSSSYTHTITGGGKLDFTAPTSGPWQGMALYQDPAIKSGVDISAAGNSPTWAITGMAYFPNAGVTFSGAVNKSSYGKSCFGMVVDNVLINGTGSILAQGECKQAGVTLPTGAAPSRGKLIL